VAGARARPPRMRQGIEMTSRARDMVFPRVVGLCSTTERLPGGAGSAGVCVLTVQLSQTERCNMTLHQQLTRKSSPGHNIKVLNSRASADTLLSKSIDYALSIAYRTISIVYVRARSHGAPVPRKQLTRARHDASRSRAAPPGRGGYRGGRNIQVTYKAEALDIPPYEPTRGEAALPSSRRDSPLALHMSHRTERL
jgi:hypothetical protein